MRALFVAAFILLLAAPGMARAHTIVLRGISFSDELGGFVLEKVSGRGSIADPFVVVERLTDINGATLVFRAEPGRKDVLLRIASAYETASRRRIPPPRFGPLRE